LTVEQLKPPGEAVAMNAVTPVTPLAAGGPQETVAAAALGLACTESGGPGTPTIADAGLDGFEAPEVVEAITVTS
jgi:hypothetical protein